MPHRLGQPVPLTFHLEAALLAYGQALLAAPRAGAPDFPWSPELQPEAACLGSGIDQIEAACEIGARLQAMLRGIEAWQRHPYRRAVEEPPVIWRRGAARLLDYGPPGGRPVLVVPSLINRSYIVDLLPERSMLRWLARQGLRPILLDWGVPAREEAAFDLGRYGSERLLPALEAVCAQAEGPVAVLGYCMGGTLAAGVAARMPDRVAALVTIGAPWDFASTRGIAGGLRAMLRARGAARVEAQIAAAGTAFGAVPVAVFQALFALVSPMQAAIKFRRFASLDPRSASARLFVALEDWLADGVPMAAPAARDLLVDWQIRNATGRRQWRFLGGTVDPRAIRAPTLAFCGRVDTIAPQPVTLPLGAAIPGAVVARPDAGHVGMIVGSRAQDQVWRPIAEFLAEPLG